MGRRLVLIAVGALLALAGCTRKKPPTAVGPPTPSPTKAVAVVEPEQPPYVVDGKLVWGELKGRFVFDGEIPPQRDMAVIKDQAVCAPAREDETLLIDEPSRGIANVYIWLARETGTPYRQHESVGKRFQSDAILTIKGCRFEHAQVWLTRQQIVINNEDPVGHNPMYSVSRNQGSSALAPANGKMNWRFPVAEPSPIPMTCNIHPWMNAHALVLDHPYAAITDRDGKFVIPKISVGKHRFRFWHERAGFIKEVKIDNTIEVFPKGAKQFEIPIDGVDLGDVHVAANQFNR